MHIRPVQKRQPIHGERCGGGGETDAKGGRRMPSTWIGSSRYETRELSFPIQERRFCSEGYRLWSVGFHKARYVREKKKRSSGQGHLNIELLFLGIPALLKLQQLDPTLM